MIANNLPVSALNPSSMLAAGSMVKPPETVKAEMTAPGSVSVVPPFGLVPETVTPQPFNDTVPDPMPIGEPIHPDAESPPQYDGGFDAGEWQDVDDEFPGTWQEM
jgi:hypothetical protein